MSKSKLIQAIVDLLTIQKKKTFEKFDLKPDSNEVRKLANPPNRGSRLPEVY